MEFVKEMRKKTIKSAQNKRLVCAAGGLEVVTYGVTYHKAWCIVSILLKLDIIYY